MQAGINQVIILIATTTALFFIMGIFIVSILHLHRKKQERNELLLQEMKTSHENELLKAQIEVQEQTFQDISREIHDKINLSLTLAKIKLVSLAERHTTELHSSIEIIGEAINDLTDLSRSMNSEVIKDCGLVTALSMELKRIKKMHKISVEFTLSGSPIFLDSNKELYLFRVVQEALNNILKHANASSIYIDLLYKENMLFIKIKDNGKGLMTNQVLNNSLAFPSSGLKSMYKRIEFLKGKMEISSKPNSGTIVTIILPISKIA